MLNVTRALEYLFFRNPLVVIHGGAKGADRMAKDWALEKGCDLVPFPAEWEKYGRKAGPIRNQRMLDEGKPDIVLAFPDKDSVGTWDMVKRAQKAGLEVLVHTGVGLCRLAHTDGYASGSPGGPVTGAVTPEPPAATGDAPGLPGTLNDGYASGS